MKKTYMKPNMEVVKLQLEQVIATSNITLGGSAEIKGGIVTMEDKEDDFDATDELW